MKIKFVLLALGILGFSGCQTSEDGTTPATATLQTAAPELTYPDTATVEQVDVYHGTRVADPYRWLEDDVRENPKVRAWTDAQHALTRSYLDALPTREAFARSLRSLWNYERIGVPTEAGDRFFYSYNDGLMNQNQIWVREGEGGKARLLLDPNAWAADGTTALASYAPSNDGRYLAYLVQEDGSDWRRARVLDVDSGQVRSDDLQWLKFTGLSWRGDSSGFYYSRYPEPAPGETFQSLNKNHAQYFHRLGDPQAKDMRVIHHAEHPEWGYSTSVSHDDAWVVTSIWENSARQNQVMVQDLRDASAPRFLIEGFDQQYSFIAHLNGELFFKTDLDAPLGRVIAMNPHSGAMREVVAEQRDVLQSVVAAGDRLLLVYLQDAHAALRMVDTSGGNATDVALPALGSISGVSGEPGNNTAYLGFSSFAHPPEVLALQTATAALNTVNRASVAVDPNAFEVQQRFATSKDGTRVPLFVVHKKGLQLDGSNPTILYGYGGFAVSLTPGYSSARMAWLAAGGVYVVANLRGGGEYGNHWHQAGTRLNKQNVFDDFIAAAEALISAGYTRPEHLAIMGGSNGGLLVGAASNQRPDLFAAAVPQVGVMDMLRYHQFTAGRFWVSDYGSADDAQEFSALYAYSPYHNIEPGARYPATLVVTADTDDRVVPGHSFKYAARLQREAAVDRPVLLYVESNAGHGAGTPTEKLIRRYSDVWAFLWDALGQKAG